MRFRRFGTLIVWLSIAAGPAVALAASPESLDPRGQIHIPIGIANTLDTLKTFVEAEGNFSPGFGSYGICFWVWDEDSKQLTAPTMDRVNCERGLAGNGYLIPWVQWNAGSIAVRTEVCHVLCRTPAGEAHVVGARAHLTNRGGQPKRISLYVAMRSLGAAGWPVREIAVAQEGDALLVEGHPAIVADQPPTAAGVLASDAIGSLALQGEMPHDQQASSPSGDCSGALRFDLTLSPDESATRGFVCPVLPGRRAVGHQWDGVSKWAQFDLAKPNPAEGGVLQPDPGLDHCRTLNADELFDQAMSYWQNLAGRVRLQLPDPRWAEAFAAITGHCAICMNEGAPDVAVVNYNVFNRDGVYVANILQKAGQAELAEQAIDYFLGHPFNGRVQPEADNPGQILWVMGEHWKITRDRPWLDRVYPAVRRIAAMIRYYRTTPEPHWVWDTSLDFGDALPETKRKQLEPGACDGFHPEYTEAFDVAGLRGAVVLAEAIGNRDDAAAWRALADRLLQQYDQRFGDRLPKGYGSYSVLWPCRLYPIGQGKAFEQFEHVGPQRPTTWRYFPLATAHQGLLAGNRSAGCETLAVHLGHEQMRGWYAFDEGGRSGTGGWNHVRTPWKQGPHSVAMPHGWAIAEFHLLLRDSLVFEDDDRLVLLAGVPPEWFSHPKGMRLVDLPTHFGKLSLTYARTGNGGLLSLAGSAKPPGGFVLRLPASLDAHTFVDGQAIVRTGAGDFRLPPETRQARIEFTN